MRESESTNSFSININNKKYEFKCPDGEDHVRAIEEKLSSVLKAIAGDEPGHVLSDFAVKVALVLADEVVGERKERIRQLNEIEEKVSPILAELDKTMGIS